MSANLPGALTWSWKWSTMISALTNSVYRVSQHSGAAFFSSAFLGSNSGASSIFLTAVVAFNAYSLHIEKKRSLDACFIGSYRKGCA